MRMKQNHKYKNEPKLVEKSKCKDESTDRLIKNWRDVRSEIEIDRWK
jgi:hypothetical protein